ncbi:MAG: ferritin family protein [Chloroflexi bacterium]|nr:ferritin family protein [Chloroflexota bacterium]
MTISENPIHNILRTAIQREIDAYTLYSTTAQKVDNPQARDMLNDLAAQEVGHRTKLEGLLDGRVFRVLNRSQQKKVEDLKITDYLIEVPLDEDSSLQDVLIVAGKREDASHNLYASLAQIADDEQTRKLFEFLANEELGHKRRVETLYEQLIYQDN